jgi:hypothetical protein
VRLSDSNDVHYTLTKDQVHLVWKVSRVGEHATAAAGDRVGAARRGFNSPFEECAIARELAEAGIPTTSIRAIYRTGTRKLEPSPDHSRYDSHRGLHCPDGSAVLRDSSNYILISGYFNGPDDWVAQHDGALLRPLDLRRAVEEGRIPAADAQFAVRSMRARLGRAGFDGGLLEERDLLIAIEPDGRVQHDASGVIETRICDFSLITRLAAG